jgi:hypothetical protein
VLGWTAVVIVWLLALPLPANAQKDSAVAVGAAVSVYRSTDDQIEHPWGIGVVARLRRSTGFGFGIGLNWVTATVNDEIGGETTKVATLVVRPLMGGIVYTRQYARFAVSASLVAGYSFNGLRDTGDAADTLARAGQPGASFAVGDTFVYRPSVSLWWELSNRFAFLTSLSYLDTRPEIVTTTPAGVSRQRLCMCAPLLTFGIGYGVF